MGPNETTSSADLAWMGLSMVIQHVALTSPNPQHVDILMCRIDLVQARPVRPQKPTSSSSVRAIASSHSLVPQTFIAAVIDCRGMVSEAYLRGRLADSPDSWPRSVIFSLRHIVSRFYRSRPGSAYLARRAGDPYHHQELAARRLQPNVVRS